MKHHIYLFTMDITLDGGVERVVTNMANSFSKRNMHVDIISLFKKNDKIKFSIPDDVEVKYIYNRMSFDIWIEKCPVRQIQLLWRLLLALKFSKKMYKLIDDMTCQDENAILFCNSYLITPFYKHNNVSIIGLDHSRYPFGNKTKGTKHWLHTYMIRKFDIITTLNADELYKWKSIGKPVYVMPNYLPSIYIDKTATKKRGKVILSIGRMNTNQKGFDRLINVYSLIALKNQDWKLKIYGSGNLQSDYISQISSLGLQKYIEIHGFSEHPQDLYQTSSIYVMCSREEGFPMVLLEAGSQGLPLISYDIEFGPKTIIKEGITGYLIPDGNITLFAKSLDALMNNEKLRNQMSLNIIEDINNRYSEDFMIDKWNDLIETI